MNGAQAVEHILEHTGVKGMKWGVRRKATVGAQEVVVSDTRKKIKTSGGAGHPASADAIRARTTGQIVKKSGSKAISDKDLRDYANRLDLEQRVKRAQYAESNPVKKAVLRIAGRAGENTAQNAANEGATRAGRRAVKFAIAAAS